ncbi:transcription factor IIIC subunit delta N-term-domain-containing protein, partial [Mycena pura]
PSIYSAFSIPSVTSRPSPSCLQWSADGQLFFLSKGSVYILASLCCTTQHAQSSHVRWFSTMLDFNPRDVHSWAAASQAWGALALGSLDVGLRAIACSPSNLTPNGACVAAILSTNMDLSLWHTVSNAVSGAWVKFCEVTPLVIQLATREPCSTAERTVRSQTVCLVWSPHADFNVVPAPSLNSSLLVTGMRAGTLMLVNLTLEHVVTVEVSDEWITHLAFSAWIPVKSGESEIELAYGTACGAVGLVRIIQTLCPVSSSSGFSPDYTIQTRVEKHDITVFQPTSTGITALSCILPLGQIVLVRATPGIVSLWSGAPSKLGWSGHRLIRLFTQELSVGSSSFQPVSGLHYAHGADALLVSLFDGSIHVIDSLTREPKLANVSQHPGDLTSGALSCLLRSAFARTERAKVSRLDVNRVSGLTPFDDSSVVLWVQESAQPSNFDYKYDVLHENTLVGKSYYSQLASAMLMFLAQTLLRDVRWSLTHKFPASGETPLHLLRPIFLRSLDLLELHPRVVEALLANSKTCPPAPEIPPWGGAADDPQLRAELRKSLKEHLFGCDVLLSLRLRLSLADFCWASLRHAADAAQRGEYNTVAHHLLQIVSAITVRILSRHLSAVVGCLQDCDIPFVARIAMQAAAPGTPPVLRADGAALLEKLSAAFSLEAGEFERLATKETCPACGLDIYLDGGSEATCPNGHSWGRCAATTFILSTPMLRTCTGCKRKVLLPPSSCRRGADSDSSARTTWLPRPARSWVVEEFLEAVSRCLFCGNNFCSIF